MVTITNGKACEESAHKRRYANTLWKRNVNNNLTSAVTKVLRSYQRTWCPVHMMPWQIPLVNGKQLSQAGVQGGGQCDMGCVRTKTTTGAVRAGCAHESPSHLCEEPPSYFLPWASFSPSVPPPPPFLYHFPLFPPSLLPALELGWQEEQQGHTAAGVVTCVNLSLLEPAVIWHWL